MGIFRHSVFLIRLVLAVSLLLPSFVYADPPAAAPTASFNAPSFSGGGQGNQGTTGQSGSSSSGSGAANGQTGSNSTGGSTRQNSSSPVTNPEDSSATQPTNSFVAPNTEDLQNDPRGIQVINLFKEVLSREPNSRELADRVGDLVTNRTTLDAMRREFLASDERYKIQINSLYRKYLGRPIDRPAWESLVQRRPHPSLDAVKGGLERSDEYKKRQIVDLYIKHLDRAPDPKALQALLEANAGRPLDVLQLENDLRFSTEYATSWYINAFAQRLKKCPSKVELQAIVPLLKSKKATYAQAAQALDAQVPRGYDGYPLVNNDPIPLVCPNAFDSATNEARTQLTNYVLTSVQIKISSPRDFQIADLKNRLANLRVEIEKQTSLLNGTRQNISTLKKELDELSSFYTYAVAAASGTITATKRNLGSMRDLETEQAARLEQLQQSARTLERIIAEFEGGGGDDDLYYSAPNERLRTVITTDASREADRRFGEELSQASYKLAIAEGGLKATQQGLVSAAVIGTVVMSGGATLPVLLTATANGTVIGFFASGSEAVGQVSTGNLTYTEAQDKATKDFLRYTGQAATTAGSMLVGGVAKAGVLGLGRATASRMVAGSVQQYRVAYWTPSAAFFASGSASAAVGSTISNAPRWYSGEKSAAEIAQMIGVDMLFGGAAGLTGGNIKNLMADAAADLSLATVQSFLKGEIDPNKPQETTEAILGNLISTATSSASAKYKQNLDTQRNSGGSGPINNTTAPLTSDGLIREAISNLVPKGTLDAIMQNVKNDVLQGNNISKILPVEILVRIPGLDPIKKPQEYKAAYDAVSKALEQARMVADQKSGVSAPIRNSSPTSEQYQTFRGIVGKINDGSVERADRLADTLGRDTLETLIKVQQTLADSAKFEALREEYKIAKLDDAREKVISEFLVENQISAQSSFPFKFIEKLLVEYRDNKGTPEARAAKAWKDMYTMLLEATDGLSNFDTYPLVFGLDRPPGGVSLKDASKLVNGAYFGNLELLGLIRKDPTPNWSRAFNGILTDSLANGRPVKFIVDGIDFKGDYWQKGRFTKIELAAFVKNQNAPGFFEIVKFGNMNELGFNAMSEAQARTFLEKAAAALKSSPAPSYE